MCFWRHIIGKSCSFASFFIVNLQGEFKLITASYRQTNCIIVGFMTENKILLLVQVKIVNIKVWFKVRDAKHLSLFYSIWKQKEKS